MARKGYIEKQMLTRKRKRYKVAIAKYDKYKRAKISDAQEDSSGDY